MKQKKNPFKRILYLINKFHEPTGRFLYDLKYAFERAYYGFSEQDCWSISYTLDTLIPKMLRHLQTTKRGVPVCFLTETWDHTDAELEEGLRKHNAMLDRIIEGFEAHLDYTENFHLYFQDKEKSRVAEEKFKVAMQLLTEHYDILGD